MGQAGGKSQCEGAPAPCMPLADSPRDPNRRMCIFETGLPEPELEPEPEPEPEPDSFRYIRPRRMYLDELNSVNLTEFDHDILFSSENM